MIEEVIKILMLLPRNKRRIVSEFIYQKDVEIQQLKNKLKKQ
jgi:hypothetical protein